MTGLMKEAIYIFFIIMEYSIFAYIVLSWIPSLKGFRNLFYRFLDPLFSIIRYLLKYSVFHTARIDMAPFIALFILAYLKIILM